MSMHTVGRERLAAMLLVLVAAWWVTNLSMTVSAFHDGRAVTLGILAEPAAFIAANTNADLRASLERLEQNEIPVFSEWLLGSPYQDSLAYMNMAMGGPSYEPYSLRILYPALVSAVAEPLSRALDASGAERVSVYSMAFMVLNMLFFALSLGLATRFLLREGIVPALAVSVAMLSFLQLGYLSTLHAPMVDQPAVFLSLLFLYCVHGGRLRSALAIGIAMVLTKDSLIILAAAPAIAWLGDRRALHLMAIGLMVATFVGLRLWSGVDPLSVQFGWNVSEGEIRTYILMNHLGNLDGFFNWLLGLWSSFGPLLLLAPLLLLSGGLTRREIGVVLVLLAVSAGYIVAQLLLSGRVARTVAPASIPLAVATFGLLCKYHRPSIDAACARLLGAVRGIPSGP